ncbi:MAG: DUF362 domain-containing protein [Acidobacteria bacterium]|nr:DUF362 domain-containing protein [Acidobacteriota bacterium]
MQLSRRDLLRGLAAATPGLPRDYFSLDPFIEAHPKAVFVCRTRVPSKTDAAAKLQAGLKLAREIFVPSAAPGIPISHRIVLKPNPTVVRSRNRPEVETWGAGTDPQFYEGLLMGLKELGLRKFHFVEANAYHQWALRGWVDINDRHGVEMIEPERRARNFRDGYQMTWSKVPGAVVYARIPHYAPVNEPNTWLLNIAKWKAHGMCLTQAVKNEQGLVVMPFVRFCAGWSMVTGVSDWMKPDIAPQVEERVNRYFENHRRLGYSRYDSRAQLGPIAQEIWAHKTCDNQSVLKTGLSIIEGIYGRDGDGFGVGDDYLTNLVMFGQDKWRLDLVGLWLGGHEPGNVHLYRIAKERGLSDTFNPWDVAVYEWIDGAAVPRKLTDFQRTPLKTYYLQKDGEPYLHLVNEPFDYDRHKT